MPSTESTQTAKFRMTNKAGLSLLILTTTAFFVLAAIPRTASAPVSSTGQIEPLAGTSSQAVSRETAVKPTLRPALVPICACESTGSKYGKPTQWEDDGVTVRTGRINPADKGMCQINTEPRNGHLVQSRKLGFDIYTEEGNIRYANWLYDHLGTQPWDWSKSCWGE